MPRPRTRVHTTWLGLDITLPKGAKRLTAAHKRAILARYTKTDVQRAGGTIRIKKTRGPQPKCRGIFFKANTFIIRCERNRGDKRAHRVFQRERTGRTRTGYEAVYGEEQIYATRGGKKKRRGGMSKAAGRRWKSLKRVQKRNAKGQFTPIRRARRAAA